MAEQATVSLLFFPCAVSAGASVIPVCRVVNVLGPLPHKTQQQPADVEEERDEAYEDG